MITTPIDLSRLPFPAVVETIDFETLLAERKAALIALYPADQQAEMAATLELESEPIVILLQENTYREVLLRQRINDAARAVMLAYATGADLDQLAALFGVQRLVITAADPEHDIAEVLESDTDLRKRVQLAPEGFSVAGPEGAYIFHALEADARVLDAAVKSPSPGQVLVTILARDGDGTAAADLLATVDTALTADTVRPITDQVIVQSAEIVAYSITAQIFVFAGPDPALVLAAAQSKIATYVADCHRIGREVAISGIHAALHVAGVERVELTEPVANVIQTDTQAPHCLAINVTMGGING